MSHFNFPLKNPSFSIAEAKSLGRLPNGGLDLVQAAGDVAFKNIHSQVSGQFRENRERFFCVFGGIFHFSFSKRGVSYNVTKTKHRV